VLILHTQDLAKRLYTRRGRKGKWSHRWEGGGEFCIDRKLGMNGKFAPIPGRYEPAPLGGGGGDVLVSSRKNRGKTTRKTG